MGGEGENEGSAQGRGGDRGMDKEWTREERRDREGGDDKAARLDDKAFALGFKA